MLTPMMMGYDGDEVNTHGTDPNNMDTDGDGVTDGDEVSNGTDPTVIPQRMNTI